MFELTPRASFLFIARFLVTYLCVLAIALSLSLFSYSERFLAGATQRFLSLVEGSGVQRVLRVEENGIRVFNSTPWNTGTSYVINGTALHHTHNLFVFLALLLAWPYLRWRMWLACLVGGLGVIFLLDVLILSGDVWEVDRENFGIQPTMVTGLLPLFAFLVGRLHPTGGGFLLPVFLWVFVFLCSAVLAPSDQPQSRGRASGKIDPERRPKATPPTSR